MTKLTLSEQFIRIYNELDSFMRKALNLGDEVDHTFLINEMAKRGNRVFEAHGYDLRLFARLRNAIVHNPYQKNTDTIAEPHKDIVKKYDDLRNLVIRPTKALSIAIPGPKIFTVTLKSNVQQILQTMIDKSYTHIPVIENSKMIGVFSEDTLFSYIAKNKNCIITDDFPIKEFEEFIPLDKHMNEYFEFITRDTLLDKIEIIFQNGLKQSKRIAVVYVTEHGNQNEKLLGMITAWDLAGKG